MQNGPQRVRNGAAGPLICTRCGSVASSGCGRSAESSPRARRDGHADGVTTRIGFAIIVAGVVLLVLRATGVIDREVVDIAAVFAIVVGSLAVAIDGEEADG